MIALLLVAGYATRLYPLTINTPKPLLPVAGRAMLDYIADELDTLPELSKIILISNHRFAGHFEEWAQKRRELSPAVPIIVLDDGTTDDSNKRGAIGDIQFAIEEEKIDEDIVIIAGDNLFTYRLKDMYDYFQDIYKDLLVAIRVPDRQQLQKLAVATIDQKGKVLKMAEKPKEPETDIAIYATYFYRKETLPLFKEYLEAGNTPDAPGNFPSWLYPRQDVYAYLAEGDCIDIGTPENYQEVLENFPTLWAGRKALPGEASHEPPRQQDFFRTPTYISGHRHPDTDSIVAAMAYEALKAKLGETAIAVRLGDINPETAMVLKRFNMTPPPSLSDVRTQVRDLDIDHPLPILPDAPLHQVWDSLKSVETKSLPVADRQGHLLGLITTGDIAGYDMNQISEANTTATLDNLLKTISGAYVCGPKLPFFQAPIYVTGRDCKLHSRGIVVGADITSETILQASAAGVLCLVACNVPDVDSFVASLSAEALAVSGTTVVTSPYEVYRTVRLVTLATSVSSIMHRKNLVCFGLKDYLDDVRNAMLSSRFRSYPVVDEAGHIAGTISRYHLIRPARKKVILVDHNEMAQSFPGLEQAEIVEIIDHHRIGDVTTDGPIYVRNEPVGSTSTIIASMYFERDIPIDPPIAGMLLAAILSDTILFKSPTCTPRDQKTAEKLARIAAVDIQDLAEMMFTPDSSLLNMTAKELLNVDFKVFRMAGSKVAIAQISSMEIDPFMARQEELLEQMEQNRKLEDYDMVMMALTDINQGGSQILVSGSLGDALERAYGEAARGKTSFWLPGVMSRKKQIVPLLSMVVGIG